MRRIVPQFLRQKKGPVLQPALKGSLNLLVTKGPEETTCENQRFSKNQSSEVSQGFH